MEWFSGVRVYYDTVKDGAAPYIVLPPFGIGVLVMCGQVYSLPGVWRGQQQKPTAYSKFSQSKSKESVKQKSGMVSGAMAQTIAYGIPVLSIAAHFWYRYKTQAQYSSVLAFAGVIASGKGNAEIDAAQFRHALPYTMLVVHFAKRILEAHFVHIISNKASVKGAAGISLLYTLGSLLPLHFQQKYVDKSFYEGGQQLMVKLGLVLFAAGEFGNGLHHYLLRRLRLKNAGSTEKKYFIPNDGLFKLCWCPHYFFELVSWYGIACTSKQAMFFLTALQMTSYLGGRSMATKAWYLDKFKGQNVGNRYAMLPLPSMQQIHCV